MNKTNNINKSNTNIKKNKTIIFEKKKSTGSNKKKLNNKIMSNNTRSDDMVSDNMILDNKILDNASGSQVDLNEIFKFFGEIFSGQNTNLKFNSDSYSDSNTQNPNTSNNNIVIHIRKECIMDIFEYQIKQQLIEITENGLLKKIDEHMDLTYDETVKKMDRILSSIEKDPGFINLSLEQLYGELENVPSQEDYDYFCNLMNLEKKLNKANSSGKEKLFTILYTICNYCIGSEINFKKIIFLIIKYELTRNELVEIIRKSNKETNQLETLDFITADMMFMSLSNFLSKSDMKVISRNIAYYFSKIC
jgi:hypothetical protein